MFSTSSLGNSQSRIALDAGDQRNQNSIVAEPSQVLRVVFGDQLDVIGIMTMTYVYIYMYNHDMRISTRKWNVTP